MVIDGKDLSCCDVGHDVQSSDCFSQDYGGLRSSCTAENLRSPSVAGTHGRDDDDLNTDYAESDVMLGCSGTATNSNNGSNNNSSEESRNSNNNAATVASRY